MNIHKRCNFYQTFFFQECVFCQYVTAISHDSSCATFRTQSLSDDYLFLFGNNRCDRLAFSSVASFSNDWTCPAGLELFPMIHSFICRVWLTLRTNLSVTRKTDHQPILFDRNARYYAAVIILDTPKLSIFWILEILTMLVFYLATVLSINSSKGTV